MEMEEVMEKDTPPIPTAISEIYEDERRKHGRARLYLDGIAEAACRHYGV